MKYKVIKEYKINNNIIRRGIAGSNCVGENEAFLLENGFIEEVKENKRWRAERDETYFLVNDYGDIMDTHDWEDGVDEDRYLTGNYFKTREEAQAYKEKLIATQKLTDIINEKNGSWVADWEDIKERKYSIIEVLKMENLEDMF